MQISHAFGGEGLRRVVDARTQTNDRGLRTRQLVLEVKHLPGPAFGQGQLPLHTFRQGAKYVLMQL